MRNPLPVTLMHCWALLPQRLFMTTYRPPIVVEPYWSQIRVSAWAAGAAPTTGASRPAVNSATADRACLSFTCRSTSSWGTLLGALSARTVLDETTPEPASKDLNGD